MSADFSQTVVNGKGYGTVELTKYNTAETKTLAGAQFALYDSNGKQVAVRRNEDGNYTYSLTASENTETTRGHFVWRIVFQNENVVGMRKTCYGMYTMRKEEQKK